MKVHVHLRSIDAMAGWLREAGFTIEAQILLNPDESTPGGIVLARRPAAIHTD